MQCLVHLYLACDIHHPLLSGTGSEDTFYFSMGATSIFFDMTIEDENDADKVASEIIDKFKEDLDKIMYGYDWTVNDKTSIFSKDYT